MVAREVSWSRFIGWHDMAHGSR